MLTRAGRKDAAKKLGEQLQETLKGIGVDRDFINQFSSALSSVESMGELAATIEHYAKLAAPFAGAASVILILKGVFTAYQQSKHREELQRACQQLMNDMIKLLDFFHQERRAELSIESSLENITAASDLFSIIQYYQEAMKPMIFEGSIEGIEHSYGLAMAY